MQTSNRQIIVPDAEHTIDKVSGVPVRSHDGDRRPLTTPIHDPMGEHHIGETHDMVAVIVGEKDRRQLRHAHVHLDQTIERHPPDIELQTNIAVLHMCAGAGSVPMRNWGAGSRRGDDRGHHRRLDGSCLASHLGQKRSGTSPTSTVVVCLLNLEEPPCQVPQ